jgi:hypothetical protein
MVAGAFDPGGLDGDLARLIADSRADEASRARQRERHLRAAATTDATLAGLLVDLAERGEPVTLRTTAGRSLTGRIGVVAQDAVVLEIGSGPSIVRLAAVSSIRRAAGERVDEPSGDRVPSRAATLAALLADLAPDRPRIALAVQGEPSLVRGELRAAGIDVLTVTLDGDPPVTVHFATAQVSELTVLASG